MLPSLFWSVVERHSTTDPAIMRVVKSFNIAHRLKFDVGTLLTQLGEMQTA